VHVGSCLGRLTVPWHNWLLPYEEADVCTCILDLLCCHSQGYMTVETSAVTCLDKCSCKQRHHRVYSGRHHGAEAACMACSGVLEFSWSMVDLHNIHILGVCAHE
jgi:hypothetical protein